MSPTAKLATSTDTPVMYSDTAINTRPPARKAPATMRSFENRSSSVPTVRMPRSTPTPPAPMRFENEPTPCSKRSRNTTRESTRTIPWPIWSSVIETMGPMALGVWTRCPNPSENSRSTRRTSSLTGACGSWCGTSGDVILVATTDASSHMTPEATMTGTEPAASTTFPPTNTPASSATVPPTVAIEFAMRRSSVGTRRGTTATAVAR